MVQPKLTVWYGAMPESNGKSNFTAILKRQGGGLDEMVDGFTIDRSEYPDRVRYEADRVRYLLGELTERPHILDYDADKHSGYKHPPTRLEAENAELAFAITAEIMRFANIHRVEDFDAPINWLARCVQDARQSIIAKRSKQNG